MFLTTFAVPCAACDHTEKIADLLSRTIKDSERAFTDCKVWRADPAKTIVAVAALQKLSASGQPSTFDHGVYGLSVFVVTTGDGEILHRFVESDWLTSDAISLSGISIDTVRYRLANDVTAFGVRTTRSNPGAEVTTLDLYVAGAGNLTRVLKGLNVVSHFSESRHDHDCYHASETDRTVAIAKSNTRGYADLVIREKNVVTEPKRSRGECTMKETRFAGRYLLRFDGNIYPKPKALQIEY